MEKIKQAEEEARKRKEEEDAARRAKEAEEARKQWCEEHFINPRNLANAVNVRNQLEAILVQLGFDVSNGGQYDDPSFSASVRKSLLSGFFMQVAVKEKTGSYTTVKDMEVGGGG